MALLPGTSGKSNLPSTLGHVETGKSLRERFYNAVLVANPHQYLLFTDRVSETGLVGIVEHFSRVVKPKPK